MKNHIRTIVLAMCLVSMLVPVQPARAQGVVSVISAGIGKAIRAMDLKIQRLQNKTIWLQNAQKTLENALSKLKLDEISEWTQKQKEQYRVYYEELARVKALISYYQRIREVVQKQAQLVGEYDRAWSLIRQDANFTEDELAYMGRVYSGILSSSLDNIEDIMLVLQSFATTMSDAKRLELINNAAARAESNFADLRSFNRQNIVLSLQRSKTQQEAEAVKKWYGIE
ncbi:conjugal transfer protein TraI [Sphingobacterium siyangense]|uniref:conjugal transfer protein TraI n=1 Tax=Sphingobacterium siyangense TaxID=459529 RepID=UPI001965AD2C|nr:conjugal transfer protein TraI [Sphingobacterium siyangense]QRY55580.1 conjugal transfer protein TraI [Sphingobacterium siyangense]